jgi:uncharacterized protein
MALSDEYVRDWHAWQQERIRKVNLPYGPLALVSQDWLTEGEPFASEFTPGHWLLRDGEISYLPDADHVAQGDHVLIDGEPALVPTHIPHRYQAGSEEEALTPVTYRDLQIETYTRLNAQGDMIHAIRVRDPQEAARKSFDHIETFPLSEDWIVPATFTPGDGAIESSQTVEATIYEASFMLGTIDVHLAGADYHLEVHGHSGGSKGTGYFVNGHYVLFGDQTNGRETYGGGRLIRFSGLEEIEAITELDFNRAETFPCSVTTYMGCTAVPFSSRLPFRLTAGEFTPPVPHERVATYTG